MELSKVSWPNQQNTIMSMFNSLLSKEELVDVTIACEGKYIKAHKMILAACSPYFKELLSLEEMNNRPIIYLHSVSYSQMKALIDHMYHGEFNIGKDELDALVVVAENLKIRGLGETLTFHGSPDFRANTCTSLNASTLSTTPVTYTLQSSLEGLITAQPRTLETQVLSSQQSSDFSSQPSINEAACASEVEDIPLLFYTEMLNNSEIHELLADKITELLNPTHQNDGDQVVKAVSSIVEKEIVDNFFIDFFEVSPDSNLQQADENAVTLEEGEIVDGDPLTSDSLISTVIEPAIPSPNETSTNLKTTPDINIQQPSVVPISSTATSTTDASAVTVSNANVVNLRTVITVVDDTFNLPETAQKVSPKKTPIIDKAQDLLQPKSKTSKRIGYKKPRMLERKSPDIITDEWRKLGRRQIQTQLSPENTSKRVLRSRTKQHIVSKSETLDTTNTSKATTTKIDIKTPLHTSGLVHPTPTLTSIPETRIDAFVSNDTPLPNTDSIIRMETVINIVENAFKIPQKKEIVRETETIPTDSAQVDTQSEVKTPLKSSYKIPRMSGRKSLDVSDTHPLNAWIKLGQRQPKLSLEDTSKQNPRNPFEFSHTDFKIRTLANPPAQFESLQSKPRTELPRKSSPSVKPYTPLSIPSPVGSTVSLGQTPKMDSTADSVDTPTRRSLISSLLKCAQRLSKSPNVKPFESLEKSVVTQNNPNILQRKSFTTPRKRKTSHVRNLHFKTPPSLRTENSPSDSNENNKGDKVVSLKRRKVDVHIPFPNIKSKKKLEWGISETIKLEKIQEKEEQDHSVELDTSFAFHEKSQQATASTVPQKSPEVDAFTILQECHEKAKFTVFLKPPETDKCIVPQKSPMTDVSTVLHKCPETGEYAVLQKSSETNRCIALQKSQMTDLFTTLRESPETDKYAGLHKSPEKGISTVLQKSSAKTWIPPPTPRVISRTDHVDGWDSPSSSRTSPDGIVSLSLCHFKITPFKSGDLPPTPGHSVPGSPNKSGVHPTSLESPPLLPKLETKEIEKETKPAIKQSCTESVPPLTEFPHVLALQKLRLPFPETGINFRPVGKFRPCLRYKKQGQRRVLSISSSTSLISFLNDPTTENQKPHSTPCKDSILARLLDKGRTDNIEETKEFALSPLNNGFEHHLQKLRKSNRIKSKSGIIRK